MGFDLPVDAPQDYRRTLQFQRADWKAIGRAIKTRLPPSDIPNGVTENELEKNVITTLQRRGESLDEAQGQFSLAKRRFCREMETQKKNHWRTFLDDQDNIWKANSISKSVSHNTRTPVLHSGTRVAETDEEKVDVLMNSFFTIPPPPEGASTVRQTEERHGTRPDPLPTVTYEEI
ncbi:hypothetical protein Q7P37_000253 [Cladosporium fusiforme]